MIKVYAGDSSHDFINVHLAVVEIFADGGLIKDFFYVFHGVGTAVSWEWTRLTNRVNVTHVSDWWYDFLFVVADSVVDFLVGWEGVGHQIFFVLVGVVWTG